MARWREIRANVVRDRQQHTINALQNELQMDRIGRAYQSAAVMHDVNNPGYLENIYPQFQRRLFAEISHAQPWLSPAQVQQQALNEELSLFREWSATGRNPHEEIHARARSHYQLYTPMEIEGARREHARIQRETTRAAAQRERDAERNYRNQVGNELARRGGLTSRDAFHHNPFVRKLWQEAKRLGFIRAGVGE
jgi:hypothetical protein